MSRLSSSSFSSLLFLLAGGLVVAWIGCGSGNSSGSPTSSGAGGIGTTSGTLSSGSGACGSTPLFETDIVPIFNKSCGTADNKCHSEIAYGANKDFGCRGWLSLKDAPLADGTILLGAIPTGRAF